MKIPAEFLPKSWEMPPSARVIEESASVVARDFDGETLNWLVALVEIPTHEHPIVWIRPLDSRFDAGFVVLGAYVQIPVVITRQYALEAPDALLATMSKHKRLGRQFFFNEQDNLCGEGQIPKGALVVSAKGFCSLFAETVSEKMDDAIPFNYGVSVSINEFLQLSALEVWEEVSNNQDEKIEFARQFSFMDENERRKQMFDCECGTIEEVEEMFRTLLISQSFWNEIPDAVVVQLHSSADKQRLNLSWFDSAFEDKEISHSLESDVAKIWNWSRPINEDFSKKAAHMRWFEANVPKIGLVVERPTAHEQLEAQLRWREWKANHEKI